MPRARPLCILVVEDNPDAAESLAVLLGLYGHEPHVARTSHEAVRLAELFTPDVVLLDIGLPGTDGYAVAHQLCKVLERRPLLVALTGHQHTGERCREAGFDHHFLKPVDPSVLQILLDGYATRLAEGTYET